MFVVCHSESSHIKTTAVTLRLEVVVYTCACVRVCVRVCARVRVCVCHKLILFSVCFLNNSQVFEVFRSVRALRVTSAYLRDTAIEKNFNKHFDNVTL